MDLRNPRGKTASRGNPRQVAPRPASANASLLSPGTPSLELRRCLTLETADPDPVEPPHRPLPDLLPSQLRSWTFDRLDEFRAPLAYHVCREYATHGEYQGRKCLLLTGKVGIGKSSLAAAIVHQTIAQTQDPHYARYWSLRQGYRVIGESLSLPPDQHLHLSDLLAHPLLIVDHVDWPRSAWETEQLYRLIESLCAEERPAVFVTDLAPEDLQQALVYAQVWPYLSMCHLVEAWEPGTPPQWPYGQGPLPGHLELATSVRRVPSADRSVGVPVT
jgi:hypothetical protein